MEKYLLAIVLSGDGGITRFEIHRDLVDFVVDLNMLVGGLNY